MKDLKERIIEIILVLSGLFIAYQLIRAILGGSWQTETLVITLLVFNLGISWKINSGLWKLNSKFENILDGIKVKTVKINQFNPLVSSSLHFSLQKLTNPPAKGMSIIASSLFSSISIPQAQH